MAVLEMESHRFIQFTYRRRSDNSARGVDSIIEYADDLGRPISRQADEVVQFNSDVIDSDFGLTTVRTPEGFSGQAFCTTSGDCRFILLAVCA